MDARGQSTGRSERRVLQQHGCPRRRARQATKGDRDDSDHASRPAAPHVLNTRPMPGRGRRRAALLASTITALPALGIAPAAAAALPGQTFTLAWGGDVTPGSDYGMPRAHATNMLA